MPSARPPAPLPVALTIAGSDSGGGAGIQADLKTFHAWGVYGTTAVTAITVQDTARVHGVHPVPTATIVAQIEVVARDLEPAAVKTGMLHSGEVVSAVAGAIQRCGLPNYVLDPVMVATSGDVLLEPEAVNRILEDLVPVATLVTPNGPEAALLTGMKVERPADMARAGRSLVDAGARAALVKGGHLPGDDVVDVLWDGENEQTFRRPRIATRSTHGTGCTLSAAVAAGLARGRTLDAAVEGALDFVHRAIREAPGLGSGHGPLSHFVRAD